MNENEITKIIQDERFWWNMTDDHILFNQKNIVYDYRPYSIKFEEPIYPNMISVRRFIYLDIYLGNSQLLDAGLVTDYHVNAATIENLKDELMIIGKDAHERFVKAFEERRYQPHISPTFQPTLDHEALALKIESLLLTGDGL